VTAAVEPLAGWLKELGLEEPMGKTAVGVTVMAFRGTNDDPKRMHNISGETASNEATWYAANRRVVEYFCN
jgi:hypothetical protein